LGAAFLAAGLFALDLTAFVFRTVFLARRFALPAFGLRIVARLAFFTFDFRFLVFLAMTISPGSLGRFSDKLWSLRPDFL
jgi:hypothetical protein